MQTFQTAAVVGLIDNMSGPLKALAANAKAAAKMIESAQPNGSALNSYNSALTSANHAANRHLAAVNQIKNSWREVHGIVAGVATAAALHKAVAAVKAYIPLERENRYMQSVGVQRDNDGKITGTGYSDAQMRSLTEQQNSGAFKYGEDPDKVAHAQMAFATRQISAETTKILTEKALILAKALGTSVEQAALILEGSIFAKGHSSQTHDPAKAAALAQRYGDIAAAMSKSGAMSPEDIIQFGKYAYSGANAAGLSDTTQAAIAMSLKRANMPGMESGTFVRQFTARLLNPTKEARGDINAILKPHGLSIEQFSKGGTIDAAGLGSMIQSTYGKKLSAAARARVDKDIGAPGSKLANRDDFISYVTSNFGKGLGATKGNHLKRLATMAGHYWDVKRIGVEGDALADAIMKYGGVQGMQALVGVKQGARGQVLTGDLGTYEENRKAVEHAIQVHRMNEVAEDRMKGLAFETDRMTNSLKVLENTFVAANTGWLVPAMQHISSAFEALAGMSDTSKQALTIGASLLGLAAGLKALSAVLGIFRGLGMLTAIGAGGAAGAAAGEGALVAGGVAAAGMSFGTAAAAIIGPALATAAATMFVDRVLSNLPKKTQDALIDNPFMPPDQAMGLAILNAGSGPAPRDPWGEAVVDASKAFGEHVASIATSMKDDLLNVVQGNYSLVGNGPEDQMRRLKKGAAEEGAPWATPEMAVQGKIEGSVVVEPSQWFLAKIQGIEESISRLIFKVSSPDTGVGLSGDGNAAGNTSHRGPR
jgi:hypothetical protein